MHAYTSFAQIPLSNVSIVITAQDGTALAMRITDRSGLTDAVELPVPDRSESQEPGADELPYALVNLYAVLPGYERVEAENLQVFPGTTTYQDLEMIPQSDNPLYEDVTKYITTPQDL